MLSAALASTLATRATASAPLSLAPEPPVYVLTSIDTLRASPLAHLAAEHHTDRFGTALGLLPLDAWQSAALSDHVHREEHRCGGYFAFETRAEALDFLARDRALSATPRPMAYSIDNATTVLPWLAQVSEPNIRATIAHLSSYQNRYYQSIHGQNAAQWIGDTWLALGQGRSDVHLESIPCTACSTQPNIVLTIDGSDLADEVVVLGGHLDSIRSGGYGNPEQFAPGADDDASGIATLTEVLRIALAQGWKPRRTVKFMGYAAEEVGLRGSNAVANQFASQGIDVVAVLQLDMTNYRSNDVPYHVQFITDFINPSLLNFSYQVFDTYLAPQGLVRKDLTCRYACSDHASWTSKNFPAVMASEAGDSGHAFFPYLHTANDTLAYIGGTANSSTPFAQLALAFLAETAKTDMTVLTDGFEDPAPSKPTP